MNEVKDLKTKEIFKFDKETGTILGYNENHPDYIEPAVVSDEYYDADYYPEDLTYPIENYDVIPEQTLIIPEEIDGIPVKTIGDGAFSCRNFKKVVLSNNLKVIGDDAFQFSKIGSINEFYKIEHIGCNAFNFSDFIVDTLIIPESVKYIGYGAFGDTIINELIINAPITIVECCAFQNCNITKLTLSDTIEKIEENAFSDNNLTEVSFPKNLIKVEDYAFIGNPIELIELNDKIESIGECCFDPDTLSTIILSPKSFMTFVKCLSEDIYHIDIETKDGHTIDCVDENDIKTVCKFLESGLISLNAGVGAIMRDARDALNKIHDCLQENKLDYGRLKQQMNSEETK